MPEKIDNLEALIDDILHGEAPMTLADLINLIAQPHRYDGRYDGLAPVLALTR